MSNFQVVFERGQEGLNLGKTTGIRTLDKAINGIQKRQNVGVAAAPKCGKTTLVDAAFLVSPYLEAEKKGTLDDLEWIYYSYEIARVDKEFKLGALFMFLDHNMRFFEYKGKQYEMSPNYLMGRLKDEDTGEVIKLTSDHREALINVYRNRIIPLFGRYDEHGRKLLHDKEGKELPPSKIIFFQNADNPTGMYKYLMGYARKHGEFIEEGYEVAEDNGTMIQKKKIVGYVEKDPNFHTIVICDHIRKPKRERGFTMKENIDKWLEYSTELRNNCNHTYVNICHSNRGISNVERLKFAGENIFPTADDIKDTGNLAEESTILMTLFNPHDEKYNLQNHMGVNLQENPNYRSLHITESRETPCPAHIQLNMFGNVNYFTPLINM